MNNLSQRAVSCKHWRWMPGMLSLPPQADRCQRDGQMMVERLPDLTDPATVGCLLALVREAGAIVHKLAILPMGTRLFVEWPNGLLAEYTGSTLGEALVSALELCAKETIEESLDGMLVTGRFGGWAGPS